MRVFKLPLHLMIGSICLTLSVIAVINPELRANIRGALVPEGRKVLAVAYAKLSPTPDFYQILKVKTSKGLFVEVYSGSNMVAAAKLPDSRDGYFTFGGRVTNLAVDDINNDSTPEILATAYDDDLVGHIHAYRFNPIEKQLSIVPLKE